MAKSINLSKYPGIRDGKFRKDLFECVGDDLFGVKDKQAFLFEVLKRIVPVNEKLKNNAASIHETCGEILKHFRIFDMPRSVAMVLEAGVSTTRVSRELGVDEKFWKFILQLDQPPAKNYFELKASIETDLKELNELIKWYESNKPVQKYIENGGRPQNHDEKILIDYYNRCTKERTIIWGHYLNNIKKRAIINSGDFSWLANSDIHRWSKDYYDRPYYFARARSLPYFDCRKIDLVAHRLVDFAGNELEFEKLYAVNKPLFYKRMFKKEKAVNILQEFDFYLSRIPMTNNRQPIFDELKKLFKSSRWIGFYALALSQIEGLFTEMYQLINPENEKGWKSLPAKVASLRPFHDMSQYFFDYYEYHIPKLRNKFMHAGFEDDFKIKSFDLFFDLRYLLRIFDELNEPSVKLNKLFVNRNPMDFINYTDYAGYFTILNSLTKSKTESLKSKIQDFEKQFLKEQCDVDYVCFELIQQLPTAVKTFVSDINFRIKPFPDLDIGIYDETELNNFLRNEKLKRNLHHFFWFNQDSFNQIEVFNIYLQNYKKRLPSLDKVYKDLLAIHEKDYGSLLKNLVILEKLVRDVPEEDSIA